MLDIEPEIDIETIKALQSPSSIEDRKRELSDSAGDQEFQSCEAPKEELSSPPAEPPIDTHYKKRLGSKPPRVGPFLNPNSSKEVKVANYVLTDNCQILKAINMNKM